MKEIYRNNIPKILLVSSILIMTGCTEKSYSLVKTVDSNHTKTNANYHSKTKYTYYYKGDGNCCDKSYPLKKPVAKTKVNTKQVKNVNINITIKANKKPKCLSNCPNNATFDVDGDDIDYY